MTTQEKIRQKYIEKNGGLDEVFNNLDKKKKYEKFLTEMLNVKWTQKR